MKAAAATAEMFARVAFDHSSLRGRLFRSEISLFRFLFFGFCRRPPRMLRRSTRLPQFKAEGGEPKTPATNVIASQIGAHSLAVNFNPSSKLSKRNDKSVPSLK